MTPEVFLAENQIKIPYPKDCIVLVSMETALKALYLEREQTQQRLEKQGEKEKKTELLDGEDYGIDGLYHAIEILERTFGLVEGYRTDDGRLEHQIAIDTLKSIQNKPKWNEEDEKVFNNLIGGLIRISHHTYTDCTSPNYTFFTEIEWLKSLKQRMEE